MDTLTIRPMAAADIPVVAAWMVTAPLWQRYGVRADAARMHFEQALARQDILLVADLGDQNCACGFAWCLPAGAFGRSAYLRLIGVHPDHAGGGIGSALLAATERAAAEVSRDLFLLVSDFNVEAQQFYQRQGYIQVGAIPGFVLPDVTELIFRKRLQAGDGLRDVLDPRLWGIL